MLGRILGAALSLPVRLANVPVKMAERAAEAADEFMLGTGFSNGTYQAPKRNFLDRTADAIADSCEDALDD